jgi:phospholipase A1
MAILRFFDGPISRFPVCICLVISVTAGAALGADRAEWRSECAKIADDAARLRCFDAYSARDKAEGTGTESYLSRLWELEKGSRSRGFPITPYRSNYILPYTHNTTPNEGPIREADPGKEVQKNEVNFQISFKVKLWEDVLDREMDLWVAYTQRSFWQFYNFADSAPFRETDFEPELLLNVRTNYRLLGFRGRFVNAGLNHQSNGRAEPLSRSWNRVVANFGFERGNVVLLLNVWYRIPEDEAEDDNPGIEDYLGYGQLNVFYRWRGHMFGLLARNNLRGHGNKGALQVTWSFPLLRSVSGYVHYFNGYGESLLDYNASANRIGVGFILKEW